MNEAVTLEGDAMIVMTRAEYETLVEDIGDGAIADHAHSCTERDGSPAMPSELVDAIFDKGLHPLAAWRMSVELTPAELAVKSGVPEATIPDIESTVSDPRLSTPRALAAALKLGIEDIVD